MANNVIEIKRACIIDPEIHALMPIFEKLFGTDQISYMINSILFENFVRYTSAVIENIGITSHFKIVNYEFGDFKLPIYNNKIIKLIPQSFLCESPEAQPW